MASAPVVLVVEDEPFVQTTLCASAEHEAVLIFTGMPLTDEDEDLARRNDAPIFYKPERYSRIAHRGVLYADAELRGTLVAKRRNVDGREVKLSLGRPGSRHNRQLEQHQNHRGAQTKNALHAGRRCETAASARSAENPL